MLQCYVGWATREINKDCKYCSLVIEANTQMSAYKTSRQLERKRGAVDRQVSNTGANSSFDMYFRRYRLMRRQPMAVDCCVSRA